MSIEKETDVNHKEEGPRIFKLITGEEIITTITRTTDHLFVIEAPLEIRYNTIKGSLYLTKWKFGADYSKVMTLTGNSVVSVSIPEPAVVEIYFQYRKSFIDHMTFHEEDYELELTFSEDDSPIFH